MCTAVLRAWSANICDPLISTDGLAVLSLLARQPRSLPTLAHLVSGFLGGGSEGVLTRSDVFLGEADAHKDPSRIQGLRLWPRLALVCCAGSRNTGARPVIQILAHTAATIIGNVSLIVLLLLRDAPSKVPGIVGVPGAWHRW